MDIAGHKWLVAPYGVSNWVRNVRAAGEVSLTRRRHTERYRAEEVTGVGAVPVLRTYIGKVRVTRPYFDATAGSSEEELLAEVPRHPVFGSLSRPDRALPPDRPPAPRHNGSRRPRRVSVSALASPAAWPGAAGRRPTRSIWLLNWYFVGVDDCTP